MTNLLRWFPIPLALLACSQPSPTAAPTAEAPPPSAAPAPPPAAPAPAVPLAAGVVAPDFESVAHTGVTIKMAALRGKPVVLYFYPKDETPG